MAFLINPTKKLCGKERINYFSDIYNIGDIDKNRPQHIETGINGLY